MKRYNLDYVLKNVGVYKTTDKGLCRFITRNLGGGNYFTLVVSPNGSFDMLINSVWADFEFVKLNKVARIEF
jgi:hypothetical protein